MRHAPWVALWLTACGAAHPALVAPPATSVEADPWFGTSALDEGEWTDERRETIRVGGTSIELVLRVWEGEGEGLFVLGPDGALLGRYAFVFGGLGGELEIVDRCVTDDWVVLLLRTEGTTRRYRLDPGQGGCPAPVSPERQQAIDDGNEDDPCVVEPGTEEAFAEVGIDASHVWLVTASSSERPTRACAAR
jgi:hypothetical protein